MRKSVCSPHDMQTSLYFFFKSFLNGVPPLLGRLHFNKEGNHTGSPRRSPIVNGRTNKTSTVKTVDIQCHLLRPGMLSGDLRNPSASRRGSRPRLPAALRLRRPAPHVQRGRVSSCNQEPLIEGCSALMFCV